MSPATKNENPTVNATRITSSGIAQYDVAAGGGAVDHEQGDERDRRGDGVDRRLDDLREHEHLTRRVHLVEQRVVHEAARAGRHRTGEERPRQQPDVEEQRVRDAMRVDRGVAHALQEREHDHEHDRADQRPREAEHLLRVRRPQVAPGQAQRDAARRPEVAQRRAEVQRPPVPGAGIGGVGDRAVDACGRSIRFVGGAVGRGGRRFPGADGGGFGRSRSRFGRGHGGGGYSRAPRAPNASRRPRVTVSAIATRRDGGRILNSRIFLLSARHT